MEKRERTRSSLIESAYRVFARKEMDAVTVDDIIAEAGVARGTFYNYFQTREDVLRAVAASLSDEMNQKIWAQYAKVSDPANVWRSPCVSFYTKRCEMTLGDGSLFALD